MSERFHILMPCAKPWNIPRLAHGILEADPHPFELRWHIMQQGPEPDPKGLRKINEALGWISDGWFWTPSDDSIHSPRLFRRVGELMASRQDAVGIVFSEQRGPEEQYKILYASREEMLPCHVDGSQCVWRRDAIGELRYDFDAHAEQADGVFAQQMAERYGERILYADEVLCRFNSLEW